MANLPLSTTRSADEQCPEGIQVVVQVRWLQEHSSVEAERYAFAYSVNITNHGSQPATLVTRHWVITDGDQQVEHIRGPGVVGYQPALQTGQSFSYTSGAVLKTPTGTMEGEYLLVRPDGSRFETRIVPFALICPVALQ
ncbi:MAG: Co2+/Mg2+ efflux protein ApaG [Deltaproteobacteria bacterium]|nr:Co2+/Mg2+ efflux protein ApaG [Deltaproteobacteria bacterium]